MKSSFDEAVDRTMTDLEGEGQPSPQEETTLTFSQICEREDPTGRLHDLKLICKVCGSSCTCRCAKPKRTFVGVCDECSEKV